MRNRVKVIKRCRTIGSLIDIYPAKSYRTNNLYNPHLHSSDLDALSNDWKASGSDMKKALDVIKDDVMVIKNQKSNFFS